MTHLAECTHWRDTPDLDFPEYCEKINDVPVWYKFKSANANFTMNSLTNAVAGSSATIIITQAFGAPYTLTSTMKYAGASKTLSTAAGSIDIIGVFYDGTTYYASLTKGYA